MSLNPQQELRTIRNMPYGTARTAAAEAITRRIEANGPPESLPEALLDLVEAYSFTGEGNKSFVAFARVLRLWDERPELFDAADERNLFWEYKWVAADLPEYPQITTAHAEAFLEDMERRFALAGHGASSVRLSRFRWAWHTGQPDVEEQRDAWVAGIRDGFEECAACTVGQQTSYFADLGRYAEAVQIGITQRDSCNQEPVRTYYATALAALHSGDPVLAAQQLKLATATDTAGPSDFSVGRSQAFEVLARGGQLDRALRVLRNELQTPLRELNTPLSRVKMLTGILAGLSANLDRGEESTGYTEPEWQTVQAMHQWVAAQAEPLARQLDARNGNDRFTRAIQAALTARRSEQPLPVPEHHAAGALQRAAAEQLDSAGADVPVPADASAPGTAALDAPHAATGNELITHAETLLSHGKHAAASQAFLAAAEVLQHEGWIALSGAALAEAAQCAVVDGDEEAAHRFFAAALPRLTTGDADPEITTAVLAAWAPIAARLRQADEQIALTEQVLADHDAREPDSAGVSAELAARKLSDWQRRRATLRDTLARSLGASGEVSVRAIGEATRAGEEFAGIGLLRDAAHAFWLAGRLQRDAGHSDDAVWSLESAFEGFGAANARDDRAHAASDLIDLLHATGRSDRAAEIVAEL